MPMMGLDNVFQTDSGSPRGSQYPIACTVWFTSTGRILPLSVKLRDSEGGFCILSNIRVLSSENKNYCGIRSVEYDCESEHRGMRIAFRLLYYVTRSEWKLLLRTKKEPDPSDS